MNDAGTPAHPRPEEPRDPGLHEQDERRLEPIEVRARAERASEDAHAAPNGTQGQGAPLSAFERMTAQETFRTPAEQIALSDHLPGEWCDPDPSAGTALGPGRNPFDRALQRWKPSGQDLVRQKFRRAMKVLVDDPDIITNDEVFQSYPWHHLTAEDAQDFQKAVYKKYSNQGTRNDTVGVIRAVIQECYKAKLISAVRLELLLEQLYTVAPGRSTRRHRISADEFDRLMDACRTTGNTFQRARNCAIMAVFWTTGIRSIELVNIDLAAWDRRDDTITLYDTKNGDTHVVFVHPGTKAFLLNWLEVRGTEPGKLFTAEHRPSTQALNPKSVRQMLASRCRTAGIKEFGCHDFRRTFATELLRQFDAVLVGKLLNHRKLDSTLIYDMSTDDEKRNAVESIRFDPRRQDGAA